MGLRGMTARANKRGYSAGQSGNFSSNALARNPSFHPAPSLAEAGCGHFEYAHAPGNPETPLSDWFLVGESRKKGQAGTLGIARPATVPSGGPSYSCINPPGSVGLEKAGSCEQSLAMERPGRPTVAAIGTDGAAAQAWRYADWLSACV